MTAVGGRGIGGRTRRYHHPFTPDTDGEMHFLCMIGNEKRSLVGERSQLQVISLAGEIYKLWRGFGDFVAKRMKAFRASQNRHIARRRHDRCRSFLRR